MDEAVVVALNREIGAELRMTGRSEHGELGGAIYAQDPAIGPVVLTRFLGTLLEAERTAEIVNNARDRGLPVPRHHRVVDIAGSIILVQERLPAAPGRPLTPARIDAIVEVNDRFAGTLALRRDVPPPPRGLTGGPSPYDETLARHSARSRRVLEDIIRIRGRGPAGMTDDDLVHVDLTAANVLFDDVGRVTGVVDWNLGAFRGDRLFALVKTRFDREWFVRSPDSDPIENAAAAHLDEVLQARIAPDLLRTYWADWMLYQFRWAIRNHLPSPVVDWHLDLAESRLRS